MRRTRKLQWVLYPSFLLVVAVSLVSIGAYTIATVHGNVVAQTGAGLGMKARLAADLLARGAMDDRARVDGIVNTVSGNLAARITVIAADGRVISDSGGDAAKLPNHLDRPEVRDALASGAGQAIRPSATLRTNMMYHAVSDPRLPGFVVRAAMPVQNAEEAVRDLVVKMLVGGVFAALLAALISWLVSRRVARPVERMAADVEMVTRADSPGRIAEPDVKEFSMLASAMNSLADDLSARLAATTVQQRELEITLSSMNEAVLLLDHERRIRLINAAGARLLHVDREGAVGRAIGDVVEVAAVRDFLSRAQDGAEACEEDITIEGDKTTFVHAFKTDVRDVTGAVTATLLVFHDITRLKRLENIRRDFVANVSHELKTPITSIKGFVETLRGGEDHDPETVARFLAIIARHTDRLSSIIEDLLVLSRIEQAENAGPASGGEDPGIAREKVLVSSIVESALLVCESRAARKGIELQVSCGADSVATVNQQLMEQALVNLVDNAVKFSDPGQPVSVSAVVEDGRLRFLVRDHGCGIPAEHLPRIFERFYRVDKGRSRSQGGTGLGLSIVRHVATIHGGKVRVTSEPGVGSEFVIDVPSGPVTGD